MTLLDFRMLSDNEQIDLLYKDGVYIGKIIEENLIKTLYQLGAFYVEVHYQKYRCFVTRLFCFSSTMLLQPYLEQMDVEDLVNC